MHTGQLSLRRLQNFTWVRGGAAGLAWRQRSSCLPYTTSRACVTLTSAQGEASAP